MLLPGSQDARARRIPPVGEHQKKTGRCRSVGANVPFIAHKADGGPISCDEERDADWDVETADRRGG